jgi:hypothetical protein
MEQKSIALTSQLWSELREEASRLGVSLGEYLRRVLHQAKGTRRRVVEGKDE